LVCISITFTADINIAPGSYITGFGGGGSGGGGKPPRRPAPIGGYKGQVSYIFLIPYLELIPPEGKVESVGN
jgi:hypothetical protein